MTLGIYLFKGKFFRAELQTHVGSLCFILQIIKENYIWKLRGMFIFKNLILQLPCNFIAYAVKTSIKSLYLEDLHVIKQSFHASKCIFTDWNRFKGYVTSEVFRNRYPQNLRKSLTLCLMFCTYTCPVTVCENG